MHTRHHFILLFATLLLVVTTGCDEDAPNTDDTAEDSTSADTTAEDSTTDAVDDTAQTDVTTETDATQEDATQEDTTQEDATQEDATADAEEDVVTPSGPLCYAPESGTLFFPPTAVGDSPSTGAFSYATLLATNCSDSVVTVSSVSLGAGTSSDLQIEFLPFVGEGTLDPGESFRVELTFTPESAGAVTGSIEITHDGGTDSIALEAEGIPDPGHCLIQIGHTLTDASDPSTALTTLVPTPAGDSYNDNFLIANVGRATCTVSAITLDSSSGAFSFPFDSQVSTPITLNFKQLKIINLQFAPTASGEDTATVTVESDDGSNATHTMNVRAVGQ